MDKGATNKALLGAAIAGIMGAAMMAAPASAKMKKAPKDIKCYGVNKCAGHGSCSGKGHACAGKNSCKGQGWLLMPKESCENIEGGSLTPAAPAAQPTNGMNGQ